MALLVPDMRVFVKWYLIKLFQVARIMNSVIHDVVIHLSVPAPIFYDGPTEWIMYWWMNHVAGGELK